MQAIVSELPTTAKLKTRVRLPRNPMNAEKETKKTMQIAEF